MKPAELMGQNQKTLMWSLFAVILVSVLTSVGGRGHFFRSGITPGPTSTPTRTLAPTFTSAPTLTPTLTFTPTPIRLLTVKVISYNVLFGAGVERKYDDLLPPELRNKNRVPEFLSLIKQAKPDMVGVQEANGWDKGTPPRAQQIAEQLKMNYYLAEAPNDFHVVLFTKFEIVEVENLSGKEGDPLFETMRALRAKLVTPDEQVLNVFVVHFDPFSTRLRLYQLDAIIDTLEPYKEQTTILLGDMNFCIDWLEYRTLEQAGWQPVAVASDVDQIWIPATANWTSKPLFPLGNFALGLSDHLPVGADISMYTAWSVTATAIPFPQPDKPLPQQDC